MQRGETDLSSQKQRGENTSNSLKTLLMMTCVHKKSNSSVRAKQQEGTAALQIKENQTIADLREGSMVMN